MNSTKTFLSQLWGFSFATKILLLLACLTLGGDFLHSQPPPPDYTYVNVPFANQSAFATHANEMLVTMPQSDSLQITPPCFGSDTTCAGWTPWSRDTAIAEHPNFPGCPILLTYKFRHCTSNSLLGEQYIEHWAVSNDSTNVACSALYAYLEAGSLTLQAQRAAQMEHDLYALITKHHFIEFNQDLMDSPVPINDTIYCDDPALTYKRSYTKGSCLGYCVGYYTRPGSGLIRWWKSRTCDAESCCQVDNQFCIDRASGTLVHTETATQFGNTNSCYQPPMTMNECFNLVYLEQMYDHRVIDCQPTCNLNFLNLGGDQIIE